MSVNAYNQVNQGMFPQGISNLIITYAHHDIKQFRNVNVTDTISQSRLFDKGSKSPPKSFTKMYNLVDYRFIRKRTQKLITQGAYLKIVHACSC